MNVLQAQYFNWAASIGVVKDDFGSPLVKDPDGNLIYIGNFRGTVDLDPGPDSFLPKKPTVKFYEFKPDNSGQLCLF